MADLKISQLTGATTPLAGTEVLPIVQSGSTVKVAVSNLTAGRTFEALGVTLTSTDAGATAAPLLDLYRDSATPAASDTLGEIEFNGEDSAGNKQTYGVIHASILSPTSTAEEGQIHFETATAGALTEKMIIGTNNLVINETGAVFNVRIEGDTDANLFYTDATNSRVGIGTITPSTKFEVAGAAKLTGSSLSIVPSTTTASAFLLNTNGGGNLFCGIDTSTGASFSGVAYGRILYSSGAYPLMFYTNDTERMRIASNGIITMTAYGAGAATFSASGVISSVSDETWKIKDGVPVNPDEMLKKLAPGYWYYNDEKKETFGKDRQLGFYAQNVNAAIGPEAAPEPETYVTKDENGLETTHSKPWGYYDRSVLAITVMSLQKALNTIEELNAKFNAYVESHP
jgi:hypothetical protein